MMKRIALSILFFIILAPSYSAKYTTTTHLNLRSCPQVSDSCSVIAVLDEGTLLNAEQEIEGWYFVEVINTGQKGWVSCDYLSSYKVDRGKLLQIRKFKDIPPGSIGFLFFRVHGSTLIDLFFVLSFIINLVFLFIFAKLINDRIDVDDHRVFLIFGGVLVFIYLVAPETFSTIMVILLLSQYFITIIFGGYETGRRLIKWKSTTFIPGILILLCVIFQLVFNHFIFEIQLLFAILIGFSLYSLIYRLAVYYSHHEGSPLNIISNPIALATALTCATAFGPVLLPRFLILQTIVFGTGLMMGIIVKEKLA